ncbi:MAG: DUF3078 domain-containing protein [Thermonemataceae bacterium]
MKRNLLTFISFLLFINLLQAQTDTTSQELWRKGANFGLNFSQVELENWAGGGESSISVTGLVGLYANMKRDKSTWDNALDITYGQARLGDQDFRKTDDQLILKSLYNRLLNKRWGFAAGLDFRTQLDEGLSFREVELPGGGTEEVATFISEFMSPGYLNTNIGFSYTIPHFKAVISPLASKLTFVLNDELAAQGAYGVDSTENIRSEAGASLNLIADYDLMENVKFKTYFLAFTDYSDGLEEIDINWEVQFIFQVNKYINTTITTQLIYDEDININREDGTVGPATQFKGVLNIGVVYNIGDKRKKE